MSRLLYGVAGLSGLGSIYGQITGREFHFEAMASLVALIGAVVVERLDRMLGR